MQTNTSRTDILRTLSSRLYPQTVGEMLDWSDWMWNRFGTYTQALKNAVRYFLGGINISPPFASDPIGGDDRRQMMDELLSKYKIFDLLGRAGDEYVQWGNSFASVDLPRVRTLACPKCKGTFPAHTVSDLKYSHNEFRGTCSLCKTAVTFSAVESTDPSADMRVTFWNPRLVSINYCPTTHTKVYSIIPSKSWKEAFSSQDPRFLAETPLEMLQAIENDGVIEMRQEHFKHIATPQPSTIEDELGGWGMPLFMSEFENVILLQMLKKYNEVILADYSVPFRVISPPSTGGGGGAVSADTLQTLNMGDFRERVTQLVNSHRSNPTHVQVSPFALNYQILGGEANQLVPMEAIDNVTNQFLNSLCIPLEFKVMSVGQTHGPPVGLRRFEKVWGTYVNVLDDWAQWLCDCKTDLMQSTKVTIRLVKASIYEDDMSRQTKVQLAMGGAISMDTGLQALGIDYSVEMTKLQDEQNMQNEMAMENQIKQSKAEELMAGMFTPQPGATALMQAEQQKQTAMGGGMPGAEGGAMMPPAAAGAGAPPMGGGGQPGQAAGIEGLWAQAEQMAEQIRVAPDRKSQLINLKKTNPSLHAFVTQIIGTSEQQAASQGVMASREQPQQ